MSSQFDGTEAEATLAFAAFGLKVAITSNDTALFERVPAYLPYGWTPSPPANLDRTYSLCPAQCGRQQIYELYRNGESCCAPDDSDQILDMLERDLRWLLADEAQDWIFIHAGAVGWRGRAIMLPGGSGAGKSTLVAELVKAGALYYSDEFAVLDFRGRSTPSPHHSKCAPKHKRVRNGDSFRNSGDTPARTHCQSDSSSPWCSVPVLRRIAADQSASGVLRMLENIAARSGPTKCWRCSPRSRSQAPAFTGERRRPDVCAAPATSSSTLRSIMRDLS